MTTPIIEGREPIFGWWRITLIVGFVIFFLGAAVFATYQNEKECSTKQGHVVAVGHGRLCVSSDGKIIE